MVKPHSPIAEVKQVSSSARICDDDEPSRPQEFYCRSRTSGSLLNSCLSDHHHHHHRHQQQAKKTNGKKRSIHFSRKIRVKDIPHISCFSQEMREQIWMTEEEHLLIRASSKMTVKMMMKGEIPQDDLEEFCPRGLEGKTRRGMHERNRIKKSVREAVLREQEAQWTNGDCDPEFLAEVSISRSKESMEKALRMAQMDAQEAEQYLNGSSSDLSTIFY